MLTKKTPDKFTKTLKIVSFDETFNLVVTYRNISPKALDEEVKARGEKMGMTRIDMALRVVDEWSSEYALTREDLEQLEEDRPGVLEGVVQGFFIGRRAAVEKN